MKVFAAASLLLFAALAASVPSVFTPVLLAQTTLPANSGDSRSGYPYNASAAASILKPPAGARVALIEFEDMECPVCAADAPAVRAAVAQYNAVDHNKLPYLRRDLPLTEIHLWSFDAAVTARYLQDRVSPAVAEQFRLAVFRAQPGIASRDDLAAFTRRWFHAHNIAQPFVMDTRCRNEVLSDRALADRLGAHGTPCVFIVTGKRWVQVTDMHQLYRAIDTAFAETASLAPQPRQRAKPVAH
jgi:protein-disulfide isomerase